MITREILHQELNKVDDQFYPLLHKIIAAFESEPKKIPSTREERQKFVETYFGIFKDDPIERGEQLPLTEREELI